jgi:two-component system chemotaxis response regulator CheY
MQQALVVDDSRVARRFVCATLQELGFAVSEASSASAALQLLRGVSLPPALITLDWNMPEMTGLDLLKILRAEPRFQESRIVMVTSEVSGQQMARALLAGADDYIMKPFSESTLKDKLSILGVHA